MSFIIKLGKISQATASVWGQIGNLLRSGLITRKAVGAPGPLSPPLPFLKLFSIAWVILSKHISSHVILLLKTPAVASHSVIADVLTKPVSPKGN